MRKSWLYVLGLVLLGAAVVQAQSDCPAAVEEALSSVDDNCSNLDRNYACYGSALVESTTVVEPRPENFFVQPADRAELLQLRDIRPQPLDTSRGSFGIGVLNVQADVPNSLPGQAVIFLLMGDARLINDGAPFSADQPFQAFYFVPGIGQADCYEAEPLLTIQTPGSITITVTLNGIETEMSPGTLLTITPTVCTIHRGNIIQRVGDDQAVLLANQSIDITIDQDGTITPIGVRGISEREYERGVLIQNAVNELAVANGWAEQFVRPPAEFDVEPDRTASGGSTGETPAATPAGTGDCETKHTVVAGDTLHKIAQRYETSVLEIAEANQLANPRQIYPGQVLCIPNPGSGFQALPPGR